jgi:hypothetical protein
MCEFEAIDLYKSKCYFSSSASRASRLPTSDFSGYHVLTTGIRPNETNQGAKLSALGNTRPSSG